MIRTTFEHELKQLKDEISLLASMVESALLASVEALKRRDIPAARSIIENDREINQKRFAIENQIMILIATQQPMAHDLRLLASGLEISSELERMGDYAKGIAKINVLMGAEPLLKPLIDIPRMAEKAAGMLHRGVTAFLEEDTAAASAIPFEDDEVDALYDQVYRELMTYVIANPKNIEQANWLLWVAHNLERVADRVANICERTLFIATGELAEIDASSSDIGPRLAA